ncbi:MAG TPA: hypothetical protein VHS96_00375, partial [Bacteroidia bacterium]|nr:hypothetical protein [Bacteroidia bacterium]
ATYFVVQFCFADNIVHSASHPASIGSNGDFSISNGIPSEESRKAANPFAASSPSPVHADVRCLLHGKCKTDGGACNSIWGAWISELDDIEPSIAN